MRRFSILIPLAAALIATAGAAPRGMFDLYAGNRAEGRPSLITEDFVLLGYAMSLDKAIGEVEEGTLLPESTKVVEELRRILRSGPPTPALDYLTVVHALLAGEDPSQPAAVAEELKRVRAAAGLARSELMLQNLDYSQFRPRGRYTRTEALQRYFTGIRYAGTVLFPVTATKSTGITAEEADRLTAEALSIARAFRQARPVMLRYSKMNARLNVLFGPAEDLNLADLWAVAGTLSMAEARAKLLERARHNGHQPAILAAPVDLGHLEPGITAADALTGWRLFPSRYTPDSAAMQDLVFDRVGNYRGTGHPESMVLIGGQPRKGFPLAREVMALLGSSEAVRSLDTTDERNYEGYPEAFRKASQSIQGGSDLTSRQLQILGEWIRAADSKNSPQRLGTALGFWTWTRYNNLLYAKQSYTPVAKGIQMAKPREAAWIEASPRLYLRLANQLDAIKTVLPSTDLATLSQMLRRCSALARAESTPAGLTGSDVEFLNGFDLALLKLTGRQDRPIIVDVHTESNSGLVLEEALGFPATATRVLADGTKAFGARFQHREFKQSMTRRLTDEEWLNVLEKEEVTKAESALPVRSAGRPRIILAAYQESPANDYSSWLNRGMELMRQSQWEPARQSFARADSLAQTAEQHAISTARIGQCLGKLGREREGIEYLQKSLEYHHFDQVEQELKEMRVSLLSRTQTVGEIQAALKDQIASHRGTRVMPARPLMLRINFEFNQATLTPEGREQVDKLGEALASLHGEAVQITGHTDLIGKPEYNQTLSERRAQAVADEIAARHGFPRTQMRTEGHGMREPLYPGTGAQESALNRRVEVMIAK